MPIPSWTMANTVRDIHAAGEASVQIGDKIYYNDDDTNPEKRRDQILAKLAPRFYYRERKNLNPERAEGTCNWFLAHPLYQQWLTSQSSSMLLVSADPGCGKSVLARHLVDYGVPSAESRTTCYFFFRDDSEDQRTAEAALRCILHQLLTVKERLLFTDAVLETFESSESSLFESVTGLWDLFVRLAGDPAAGRIVCILDGYDECERKQRKLLTKELSEFYKEKDSPGDIHFIITSRPYGTFDHGFRSVSLPDLPLIRLKGENNDEATEITHEVNSFVRAEVDRIADERSLSAETTEFLLQHLTQHPNRTYLWVKLVLNELEDDVYLGDYSKEEIVAMAPESVDNAYESILSRSCDAKMARKLLHVLLAAARPLKLDELALALAIRDEDKSHGAVTERCKSMEIFPQYIRDLCGLFVFVNDSRIYFHHQTARQFLIRDDSTTPQHSRDKWKATFDLKESNRHLFRMCMQYLQLSDVRAAPAVSHTAELAYIERYKFVVYAAKFWPSHCRDSHFTPGQPFDYETVVIQFCEEVTMRPTAAWVRVRIQESKFDLSRAVRAIPIDALDMASYFGLLTVVERLAQDHRFFWKDTSRCKYEPWGLLYAARHGYKEVVSVLLKWHGKHIQGRFLGGGMFKRAKSLDCVDTHARPPYTPLNHAISAGNVELTKALLAGGASPGPPLHKIKRDAEALKSYSEERWTQEGPLSRVRIVYPPLLLAAESGSEELFTLLLKASGTTTSEAESRREIEKLPWSELREGINYINLLRFWQ